MKESVMSLKEKITQQCFPTFKLLKNFFD